MGVALRLWLRRALLRPLAGPSVRIVPIPSFLNGVQPYAIVGSGYLLRKTHGLLLMMALDAQQQRFKFGIFIALLEQNKFRILGLELIVSALIVHSPPDGVYLSQHSCDVARSLSVNFLLW